MMVTSIERMDQELIEGFGRDPRWQQDQRWWALFTVEKGESGALVPRRLVPTAAQVLPRLPAPAYDHPLKGLYADKMGSILDGRWEEVFLPETASAWVLPDPEVYGVFSRLGQADRFSRFLLAGARARYRLDPARLKIAVLVAGGAAPGLNQVVDSIVKRHSLLATFASASVEPGAAKPDVPGTLEIVGYIGGYAGVLGGDTVQLKLSITDRRALDPGCFLKCLRTDKTEEVSQRVAQEVAKAQYDIVYTVGGEGTQRAALAMARRLDALCQEEASEAKRPVIVAGPKTMDRDLHFADTSFGFQTTVDQATDLILRMHAEAETLNRLAVVELFGAGSGFVALHSAYASGEVDYVLIPEMVEARGAEREVESCIQRLADRICHKGHAVLVVAEGASLRWLNRTFKHRAQEMKDRAFDQLAAHIEETLRAQCSQRPQWPSGFEVFTSRPRHLIRSTRPNTFDTDLCKETGKLMVDTALAGFTDCSVNLWHGQYVVVPLEATTAAVGKVDIASYYFLSMYERYFLPT